MTSKGIPIGDEPATTPADFVPRRALVVAAHPDDELQNISMARSACGAARPGDDGRPV